MKGSTMKHAYLIVAHNQIELLKTLLSLIDDEDNDIYLHIDTKWADFEETDIKNEVNKSNLFMVDRRSVVWGGFSLVQVELDLLKATLNKKYDYYHLLSGVDLPLKSQKYIHKFFEEHKGQEFISFDYKQNSEQFVDRVDQYRLFQEKYGNKKTILYYFDKVSIKIQKVFGIHRQSHFSSKLKKGSQWFSITNDLAMYILEQEKNIQKRFRMSRACDELFLQTLVFDSPFRDNLYYDNDAGRYYNMRFIDFQRGNPYVFRESDFDMLLNRQELFARKFDWNTDNKIIEKISKCILGDENNG